MTNQPANTTRWQYGIPTQEQLKTRTLLHGGSWIVKPSLSYGIVKQRQVSEFRGQPIWFLVLDDIPYKSEAEYGRTAEDN